MLLIVGLAIHTSYIYYRQMKDAFGDLQNGTVYRSDLLQCRKLNISNLRTIQDEEHILLDCLHEHLVRLRTQQQLIFPPQFEDGPARLRTFMNQPDNFGVASFVAKCLALFPLFF